MSIKPLSDYDLLPTYIRVADDLRSKLRTPGFEIGSLLPGEYEIAAQYNLSRGTIRRALSVLEAEGLLSRQPGRGTLILPPSEQAQNSRPKVAIVWTMMRWVGIDMFSALEEQLSAANCEILFRSSQHDHKIETEILTGLLNSDVDAVVLYSTGHPDIYPLILQLQDQGKPVILLDRFFLDQSETLNWVTSENERGAYEITRHLIDLGHKHIGMVIISPEYQLERISTLVEREKGYFKAINEAGLKGMLLKKYCASDAAIDDFGQEVIEFIISHQPTAIFFHNDASAYRMYAVLNQNGIRVPQDISIAGFDGLDLFPDLLSFSLTTVDQDFYGLGQEVGKLVLSLIQDSNHQLSQIRLPVRLRVGNTTAHPRQDADSRKLMPHLPGTD
jgi:GntR family transcriptional regulator of arabinose operon